MLKRLAGLAAGALVAGCAGFWGLTIPDDVDPDEVPARAGDPVNGARVFNAGGCTSCHAVPDTKGDAKLTLGGGLEIHSPFGTFLVPNISPDREHGIGDWTTAEFITAMKSGVSPEGAHYYPAFPFTSYTRMTNDDLLDLFTYMKTLPASAKPSEPHQVGFPFNIRRGLGLWKLLYLDDAPVHAEGLSWEEERGRYLVEGAGHCSECHTPRDAIGGLDKSKWLQGGPNPDGPGRIPDITNSESGIGAWTASDIETYLETGFTPEYDSVGGSMTAVVENMAKLPAEDRAAIAAYLKSVTH